MVVGDPSGVGDMVDKGVGTPPTSRRLALVLFALILILWAAAAGLSLRFLVGRRSVDRRFAATAHVNLSEPRTTPAGGTDSTDDSDALRVAIAPVISPEIAMHVYDQLVGYLAARAGRRPLLLLRSTYAEVNDLVRYRRCDLAMVCTYAFVRGEKEFGMEVLVVPQVGGSLMYHSFILVPASSPATSLLDVQGRRFGCADIMSTTGWLYPASWLRQRGQDADHFFSELVVTGSHDRSVRAVASRFVDGAAVSSMVYDRMVELDPSIRSATRIIQRSPPYGAPPFVVHPRLDAAFKSLLRSLLLNMSEDPGGRKILDSLKIDRFVVPERSLFDPIRVSVEAWESR